MFMRRYGRLAAVLCLCMMILAGCGEAKVPDVVDSPSVAVSKEGEVTVWQVGVFDKPDYVLSELQTMAAEEARAFNSLVGRNMAVVVDGVKTLEDGSKVVVEYRFDGWKSCCDFLEETFFCGTVPDAVLEGYDTKVTLNSVKDGAALSQEELGQGTENRLLITDMKANIYCPGKVTHISQGAEVNQDGSINTAGAEGMVYILFK